MFSSKREFAEVKGAMLDRKPLRMVESTSNGISDRKLRSAHLADGSSSVNGELLINPVYWRPITAEFWPGRIDMFDILILAFVQYADCQQNESKVCLLG